LTFKQRILELNSKDLSNRQIAELVGCSRRTVRRILGAQRRREYIGKREPKILLFDLETSPMEVFTWSLRVNGWLNHDNIIKDWSILSWAAKWLYDSHVISQVVTPEEAQQRRDKSILDVLWSLLDQADIIIAHNGIMFDEKIMNTRFLANGYSPPSPYQFIDTKQVLKKNFRFSSMSLDYANKYLNLDRKISTTFQLWKDCVNGDYTALNKMVEYNRQDVLALEELYLMIRPWIKSHPNLGVYTETIEPICPTCGSTRIVVRGDYGTPAGLFESYQCHSYGAISRGRKSILDKEQRSCLPISTAR